MAAGRRSLLLHLPTAEEPRFVLSSSAPLPAGDAGGASCESGCISSHGRGAGACSGAPAERHQGAYQWRELEPGIYSLDGGRLAGLLSAAEAAGAAGAAAPSSSGRGERLWAAVERHGWADGELQRLVAYERPLGEAEANGCGDRDVGRPSEAGMLQQRWEKEEEGGEEGEEGQASQQRAAQPAQQQEPRPAASDEEVRGAARQLLPVLIEAMRVRCEGLLPPAAQNGSSGGLGAGAVVAADTDGGNGTGQAEAACQQQDVEEHAQLRQGVEQARPREAPLLPAAPVLVLFSGGNDSTLMAALAHKCLPPGAPIDLSNGEGRGAARLCKTREQRWWGWRLSNRLRRSGCPMATLRRRRSAPALNARLLLLTRAVCFDGGRSPDRVAARSSLLELAAYAPDRPWRLIEVRLARAWHDLDRPRLFRRRRVAFGSTL